MYHDCVSVSANWYGVSHLPLLSLSCCSTAAISEWDVFNVSAFVDSVITVYMQTLIENFACPIVFLDREQIHLHNSGIPSNYFHCMEFRRLHSFYFLAQILVWFSWTANHLIGSMVWAFLLKFPYLMWCTAVNKISNW